MKRILMVWLGAGALMLGGCSYLSPDHGDAAVGTDIIIERNTEVETEEGPTSPWLPGEETTIEPLQLPELSTETRTVKPEIVIASDIHYLAKELTDFGSAFGEMASDRGGQMVSYIWEITDAFLDQVIARRPQALILTGDLTLSGERVSQEALAQQLKRVEDAGICVVVIPGNHDINNPQAASYKAGEAVPAETTTPEQFAEIYKDFGYGEALSRDPVSLSYTYQLPDGTWLLMLDSCQYEDGTQVGGMIRTGTYQWMEEQLEKAWEEERQVIAVAHHNLLDESKVYEENCTIEHGEELSRVLEEWGVGLFLSGHLHVQHHKTSADYAVDEIVTSALSISPCQYGILQFFGPDHYFYTTETTDVSAWADRKNNPDRNLQDFQWYADEFLQESFYREAMEELQEKELDDEQMQSMAELYAIVNVQAVGGTLYKVREGMMAEYGYELWQQYDRDSILCMYLNELLEDAVVDYNERRRP